MPTGSASASRNGINKEDEHDTSTDDQPKGKTMNTTATELDCMLVQDALTSSRTMGRAISALLVQLDIQGELLPHPLLDAVRACLAQIEAVTGPALDAMHAETSAQLQHNLRAIAGLQHALLAGDGSAAPD